MLFASVRKRSSPSRRAISATARAAKSRWTAQAAPAVNHQSQECSDEEYDSGLIHAPLGVVVSQYQQALLFVLHFAYYPVKFLGDLLALSASNCVRCRFRSFRPAQAYDRFSEVVSAIGQPVEVHELPLLGWVVGGQIANGCFGLLRTQHPLMK